MTDESKPTFEDAAAWAAANYHMDADPEGAAELAEREGRTKVECQICGEIFECDLIHICEHARKPDPPDKICSHGSLRRSCERCEDAARIAELEAECERLREDVMNLEAGVDAQDAVLSAKYNEQLLRAESAETALTAAREGEAAAMALVLNHEGHIAKLEQQLAAAEADRDAAESRRSQAFQDLRARAESLDVQLQEVQADYGELDAKLFSEVDRADKAESLACFCNPRDMCMGALRAKRDELTVPSARPDDGMVERVEACLRSWEDARFSKPGREAEWTRLIVRDVRAAIAAADGEVKP